MPTDKRRAAGSETSVTRDESAKKEGRTASGGISASVRAREAIIIDNSQKENFFRSTIVPHSSREFATFFFTGSALFLLKKKKNTRATRYLHFKRNICLPW